MSAVPFSAGGHCGHGMRQIERPSNMLELLAVNRGSTITVHYFKPFLYTVSVY